MRIHDRVTVNRVAMVRHFEDGPGGPVLVSVLSAGMMAFHSAELPRAGATGAGLNVR